MIPDTIWLLICLSPAIFLAILLIKLTIGKSSYLLFNKLFGWQYVAYPLATDMEVFRVYQDATGRLYINAYDNIVYLDMGKEGKHWFALTFRY